MAADRYRPRQYRGAAAWSESTPIPILTRIRPCCITGVRPTGVAWSAESLLNKAAAAVLPACPAADAGPGYAATSNGVNRPRGMRRGRRGPPSVGQPAAVMDHAQAAQGFDQCQLARVELVEHGVARRALRSAVPCARCGHRSAASTDPAPPARCGSHPGRRNADPGRSTGCCHGGSRHAGGWLGGADLVETLLDLAQQVSLVSA